MSYFSGVSKVGLAPYNIGLRSLVLSTRFRNFDHKFCISTDTNDNSKTEISNADLTEDVIEKKRNKSRVPELYHTRYIKKEMGPLINEWDFKIRYLRRYYATYGKKSGLNPGIMWPTKEEFVDVTEFEREFEIPVQDMIKNIETKKRLELEKRRKREEDVLAKVAKLDTWIQQYKEKEAKKLAAAEEQKAKKERLIEEVREYLGYNIDPSDAKFQEVVAQKELEEKKAKKAAKKQDRHQKMLAKLLEYTDDQNAAAKLNTDVPSATTTVAEEKQTQKHVVSPESGENTDDDSDDEKSKRK